MKPETKSLKPYVEIGVIGGELHDLSRKPSRYANFSPLDNSALRSGIYL